ncbi:unnamed protein product [Phaedon cochleariae]|uniref:carnosine N-methyltransferase n=1 Tax=Phaedon cochleariae TaxID=80249 RepID=A0A9N9SCY3_PHACE|nr:unnamed protein product [Phaedon cochleariae]
MNGEGAKEERAYFLSVLNTFKSYRKQSLLRIQHRERCYDNLPFHHQKWLEDYKEDLESLKGCIEQNASLIPQVLRDAHCIFENVFANDCPSHSEQEVGSLSEGLDKVQSVFKQLMRDWSSLGAQERDQCYGPIVKEIFTHYPKEQYKRSDITVLVPGAGLGRLAFEIASNGFACQGNEFNLFMLLMSFFVLNLCKKVDEYEVYPWIHQYCNNTKIEDQRLSVRFPDVIPMPTPESTFSMSAGDFLDVYTKPNEWHCVATCFFIDCAPNVIDFIERIYQILRPDGLWVNLGPLLYHYSDTTTSDSIEPSFQIVMKCLKYENDRETVLNLCRKEIALCIEVLLTCQCKEIDDREENIDDIYVLEQWHFDIDNKNAIRSQLYFSQITAWLTTRRPDSSGNSSNNFRYHVTPPGATLATARFHAEAARHEFPATVLGEGGRVLRLNEKTDKKPGLLLKEPRLLDDRMHTCCTVKGKHRCEEEEENHVKGERGGGGGNVKRLCQYANAQEASLDSLHHKNDLNKDKGQLLLDAIERSGKSTKASARKDESDTKCDKRASDIFSIRKTNFSIYADKHCDSPMPKLKHNKKIKDISNREPTKRFSVRQKITFDEEVKMKDEDSCRIKDGAVPSPSEQAKFRKSLDSAASMVFHSRTGLPLTSSPAPVRRGNALFSSSFSTDDESESDGSLVSPCSPDSVSIRPNEVYSVKYRRKGHAAGLLGSFEESVLNGRLEPVSTVHGFTAELGASGSFVPKHLVVPVTVFFYTLGDNDKSHINLGKKGYNVPKSGTVQVTLFNPLGTVVKMFVVMYDLDDMPANSQTFLRQRTLYMPTDCADRDIEWGPKWLRYLIHLRFISSKSGKVYLHSDIRMIIFRKSDMDTATAHGLDMSYELRSFTRMPANPRFSPRK